jgi:hypothetical protein
MYTTDFRFDPFRPGTTLSKFKALTKPTIEHARVVSFPDLLAKAYLAKTLIAFSKTFVRRSGTRFGFLLVPRGVFGPIYTERLRAQLSHTTVIT